MSSNRIVGLNGLPAGEPEPKKVKPMNQRLAEAHDHWRFKRKDEAFRETLGAIEFLSNLLAQLALGLDKMERQNQVMAREIHALREKLGEEEK